MSSAGAAPRTAVPVCHARAEASRKNGAKPRVRKTEEGKARSARSALKHGTRAQKYVVLRQEDAVEFAGLEAALLAELALVGALQVVLARRVAVVAWRLARADRLEVELFAERRYDAAGPGLALIRDGNGTRSFEPLLRYRGAAMAEFWRALRTLKVLQTERAVVTGPALAACPISPAPGPSLARRPQPREPKRGAGRRLAYAPPTPPVPGRTLHEATAPWAPRRPDAERTPNDPARACLAPNEPEPHGARGRNAGPTLNGPAGACLAPNEPARSCLAPNEPPARVSRRANPNLTGDRGRNAGAHAERTRPLVPCAKRTAGACPAPNESELHPGLRTRPRRTARPPGPAPSGEGVPRTPRVAWTS